MTNSKKILLSIIIVFALLITTLNVEAITIKSDKKIIQNVKEKIISIKDLSEEQKKWEWNINGYWENDVEGDWDIVVPCDYPTIQEAIKSATIGDRIFVRSGVYDEILEINTDGIILQGEGDNCTIVNSVDKNTVLTINANYVTVSGFTFTKSGFFNPSVKINNGIGNNFYDNIIRDNRKDGILLYHSSSNIISNNIIKNNKNGIRLEYFSSDNNIIKNQISNNKRNGICIEEISSDNIILCNNISDNNLGIKINGYSNNNFLYFNNFIENDIDANDENINNWDYSKKGNYWDEYVGVDLDSDGIGDVPKEIAGGKNKDRFPLMEPVIDPILDFPSFSENFNNEKTKVFKIKSQKIIKVDDDGDGDYNRIQYAIDNANPGDIIKVYSGIYSENIEIPIPVSIIGISEELGDKSKSKNKMKIFNSQKPIINGDGQNNIITINSDNVQINGLIIQNTNLIYSGIKILSDNNKINDTEITNCGIGLSIIGSYNNTIKDNIIEKNKQGMFIHNSSQIIISNNTVVKNDEGIKITYSSLNIKNNILNNSAHSINTYKSSKINIVNNKILSSKNFGVIIKNSKNSTLEKNVFRLNQKSALSLFKSRNISIFENEFNNNFEGILLHKSNKNCIKQNTILNQSHGVSISFSEKNNLKLNRVINCSLSGIYIGMSTSNDLCLNNLTDCGILFDGYNIESWINNVNENNVVNGKNVYYIYNEKNLDLTGNYGQIILVNCSFCKISNQDIKKASVAIQVAYSKNIVIENNTIRDIRLGIQLVHTIFSKIHQNMINKTGKFAIAILWDSNFNVISENEIYNVGNEVGIGAAASDNCVITDNIVMMTIKDKAKSKTKDKRLSFTAESSDVIAEVYFFRIGITLGFGSNANVISNNYISKLSIAIAIGSVLKSDDGALIINNTMIDNEQGIAMGYTNNNNIIDNYIYNSTYSAIALDWLSDYNNFIGNELKKGYGGIGLRTCNNNVIYKNNISEFDYLGLFLWFSANNQIKENNFFNNKKNAKFNNAFDNKWDSNYWDNWLGLKIKLYNNKPKFIQGGINPFDNKTPYIYYRIPLIWFNLDRNPSNEMIEIE